MCASKQGDSICRSGKGGQVRRTCDSECDKTDATVVDLMDVYRRRVVRPTVRKFFMRKFAGRGAPDKRP